MRWLADTNILLRSVQAAHPMYGDVSRAVSVLLNRGDDLCAIAQNLIEFWAVATADILSEWEQLVVKHQVLGKQVHDTRLIAAMHVHGITHLLTFNTADFKRYDGITVVNPSSVE